MKLKTYIDSFTENPIGKPFLERVENGRSKLFDFPYPKLSDNTVFYKDFETTFITSFYNRHIGGSTIDEFKMNMYSWLNSKMPYYNKILYSQMLEYDIIGNIDLIEEYTKTTNSVDETDTTNVKDRNNNYTRNDLSNGNERNVTIDTPQTPINIDDDSFKHASEFEINKSSNKYDSDFKQDENILNNINSNKNSDKTEVYTKKIKGKGSQENFNKVIEDYRKISVSTMELILNDISCLFIEFLEL